MDELEFGIFLNYLHQFLVQLLIFVDQFEVERITIEYRMVGIHLTIIQHYFYALMVFQEWLSTQCISFYTSMPLHILNCGTKFFEFLPPVENSVICTTISQKIFVVSVYDDSYSQEEVPIFFQDLYNC